MLPAGIVAGDINCVSSDPLDGPDRLCDVISACVAGQSRTANQTMGGVTC
jgi:hypothetical protein